MDKQNDKVILIQPFHSKVSSLYNQSHIGSRPTGIRGGGGAYLHLLYGCLSGVCIWCFMEECC